MSEFGSFSPTESTEGIDPSALERMREKMRKGQAAQSRDQKKESKQKKTEADLFSFIVGIIETLGHKHPLVQQIIKCLEQNIPALFVLSVLALIYPSVQSKVGLKLNDSEADLKAAETQSVVIPKLGEHIPLHIKLNLNAWINHLNNQCFLDPKLYSQRLQSPLNNQTCKSGPMALVSYCTQQYLQSNKLEFVPQNVVKFAKLYCNNLVERLNNFITNQQQLESGTVHHKG